ncbi:MAG: ABC transporter permease [Candidatus Woesearchaeota archaeon]|jgi:ABC-type multidrug transport system permease subunit
MIIEMIKKNFRVLIRSRSSALVILLGPFFIIFLIGAAFNTTSLHNIRVGIYTAEENEVLDEILTSLSDNEFIVVRSETEEDCVNLVKSGGAHLCMSFPGSMSEDSVAREIIFHVDYSKVNLVFTILNVISGEVDQISNDLSVEYTKMIIEQMNSTAAQIKEKSVMIADLANNAQEMKLNLELLSSELKGIEVSSSEFGLSDVDSYLAESNSQLDEFSSITSQTTSSGQEIIGGFETYIDSFEAELESQVSDIEEFQSTVNTYATIACSVDYSTISGLSFDPCSDLTSIQASLESAVTQADELGEQFDDIRDQLDDVNSQLATAESQQAEILSAAQTNLESLQSQLESSALKIDEMGAEKDSITTQLDALVTTLDENIAMISTVEQSISSMSDALANGEFGNAEDIVNPILTKIKPILEKKSYLDYTMPALVVLIIMFMSILLSSTIVMTEKESRSYFRNYIAPIPDYSFLISIFITNLIVVFIQAAIMLVIAQLAFNVSVFANLHNILIAVLVISSIFIMIGMCIGYLFVSEETATLASISLASIFLLFSSFLIPLESLSETIGSVAQYNPFVLSEAVLRQLIIFGNNLSLSDEFLLLVLYVIVLGTLVYIAELIDKRRLH